MCERQANRRLGIGKRPRTIELYINGWMWRNYIIVARVELVSSGRLRWLHVLRVAVNRSRFVARAATDCDHEEGSANATSQKDAIPPDQSDDLIEPC